MQKYKALQVIRIGAGETVVLSTVQAKDRKHFLEVVDQGKGIFKALAVLEFKAGEVVGLEKPGKALWEALQPEGQKKTLFDLHFAKGEEAKKELAKAKAEEEAKAKAKADKAKGKADKE